MKKTTFASYLIAAIAISLLFLSACGGGSDSSLSQDQINFQSQAADLKKRSETKSMQKVIEAEIYKFRNSFFAVENFKGKIINIGEKKIKVESQKHTYELRYQLDGEDTDSQTAIYFASPGDIIAWAGALERETSWTNKGFMDAPEWVGYMTSCVNDNTKKRIEKIQTTYKKEKAKLDAVAKGANTPKNMAKAFDVISEATKKFDDLKIKTNPFQKENVLSDEITDTISHFTPENWEGKVKSAEVNEYSWQSDEVNIGTFLLEGISFITHDDTFNVVLIADDCEVILPPLSLKDSRIHSYGQLAKGDKLTFSGAVYRIDFDKKRLFLKEATVSSAKIGTLSF